MKIHHPTPRPRELNPKKQQAGQGNQSTIPPPRYRDDPTPRPPLLPTHTGYPPPVSQAIKSTRAGNRWWWWRWEGAAAAVAGGRGRSWCWAAQCSGTGAPRGPPSPTSFGPALRAPSRPRYVPRTLSNPSSCLQLQTN
jgi:hypothetical protein